ncbi:cupin [Halomonas sp. PAMB 3264]|uniref:cupin n=1 Tax=Halomonas sp. PAMB 3264 TaxID=3075222 RepID=UPI00289D8A99|nr:cupin [Halomonas sp. PAMB 3264]WNL41568.1 cupin [Halomonas sp. PAMB 3264]
MSTPTLETLYLEGDVQRGFPNSRLPVLIYRGVVAHGDAEQYAQALEALFEQNGWPPAWRYHLYDFQHFHADAHEALGVFRGRARAQLGGPDGPVITLTPGDVLVLPAGTGHACLQDEGDFCMVGAYPPGQTPDLERGNPQDFDALKARAAAVALPAQGPVDGDAMTFWQAR